MLPSRSAHTASVDEEASFYLGRIKQIDRIVEGPVKTLIGLAQTRGAKDGSQTNGPLYFPTWIAAELKPAPNEDNRLTQTLCCSTLQRIRRFRRRFSWLGKSAEQLDKLREDLVGAFRPQEDGNFEQCAELLNSDAFGGLNPMTASRIFRILLEHGEASAHSGIGFLAFFAMIWPLSRTFPNRLTAGARIEPWDVTAYVTAKCLLPIRKLQDVIERRATLYDEIAEKLRGLEQNKNGKNPRDRWLFKIGLDDLHANLSHIRPLAIDKDAFKKCADSVRRVSDSNKADEEIYEDVLGSVREVLRKIRETSDRVLTDANKIVGSIKEKIATPLMEIHNELNKDTPKKLDELPAYQSLIARPLYLRFAGEHTDNPKYWEDLATAANESISYCAAALKELEQARGISLTGDITEALADLANANRKVKDVLNLPVHDAAVWCRSVVDREIAHASAEDFTDFDPSELVNGIAVAIAWNLMTTRLQVSDAVTKAIAGARKDGSWRSGKPYYSRDHATGIWAMTADIVWSLTTGLKRFPAVREADEELFNFVDWLERTRLTLRVGTEQAVSSNGAQKAAKPAREYVGWPSERLRDRGKIHLGVTALSINALIDIRNLAEYRLWELCKKRFTVLSPDKLLREIDPVDLGASHEHRLHRHLERMARQARINDEDAEYSLVLHGPPGSSKTKLAEALSAEMWRFSNRWGPSEARLIRITPADFTRMGEDRLDSEARAIFDLIGGVRAVTIFFDEIDDLLRQRDSTPGNRPTFMELVVPAMLNRLADLRGACPRQEISFILATNYVENIDSALIRKGRIDASIPVVYPDFFSRVAIVIAETRKNVKKARFSQASEDHRNAVRFFLEAPAQRESIARQTKGWPYLTLTTLCGYLVAELIKSAAPESVFEGILRDGIVKYGSSFSVPIYNNRLSERQELLNEYVHHIVSFTENPPDSLKDESGSIPEHIRERLEQLLKTVVKNEGR